jgi:hypothetical protein
MIVQRTAEVGANAALPFGGGQRPGGLGDLLFG